MGRPPATGVMGTATILPRRGPHRERSDDSAQRARLRWRRRIAPQPRLRVPATVQLPESQTRAAQPPRKRRGCRFRPLVRREVLELPPRVGSLRERPRGGLDPPLRPCDPHRRWRSRGRAASPAARRSQDPHCHHVPTRSHLRCSQFAIRLLSRQRSESADGDATPSPNPATVGMRSSGSHRPRAA